MGRYDAPMPVPVGFCSSPRFVEHDTGRSHPERPDRIRAIHKAVRDAGLIASPSPFPDFTMDLGVRPLGLPPLVELDPIPATDDQLLAVHTPGHLARVRHVTAHGGVLDQGDTPTERRSFATAVLSAGAAITAADAVMAGTVRRAFAAGRPPGHHAEPDQAMGFCLFCNVAVAARHLQLAHGVGRVAIVDFDVHHGNGTQAAFYDDPSVLFISLHQDPRTCYPGTGYAHETGTGDGRGYTLNLPFPPGAGDDAYLATIDGPVTSSLTQFRPDVLLLSAGFDAHHDDPLANIALTDDGFEQVTGRLVAVADELCDGRTVSVLEGGYDLRALGRSVVRHLVALQG
jgi:acetoin utilization deacetylase AcuC-like enzyme